MKQRTRIPLILVLDVAMIVTIIAEVAWMIAHSR